MRKEQGVRIEVPGEPSWEDVENYTKSLAKIIEESGFEPDFLIGISRGGWVPAVLLSHLMTWKPFISIDIKKEGEERRVDANPAINWTGLNGKKVLLVEDMLETGKSAQAAREFLEDNRADVKLACYFTREFSEVKPDFVLQEGIGREILFPWESFRKK